MVYNRTLCLKHSWNFFENTLELMENSGKIEITSLVDTL